MRAHYSADRAKFYGDTTDHILGEIARGHNFSLEPQQRRAWIQQIAILRVALQGEEAFALHFEFAIPRMGKRPDVVLIIRGCVFVIEFKVGEDHYSQQARLQVEDYALDLKNFHEGSHNISIVPVLVATWALESAPYQLELALDQVAKPLLIAVRDLSDVVRVISRAHASSVEPTAWAATGYRPTPTIIEAARVLFSGHNVQDITRHEAGAENLRQTQNLVSAIIQSSRTHRQKSVCFITGVPGAGKTLAGLTVATSRSDLGEEHATFLSGNDPLVNVLTEALVRDRLSASPKGTSRGHVERKVRGFIHNIRHFRDDYLGDLNPPSDHVVIFHEAQRAWTQSKASSFMRAKRGVENFGMSEPEFLLGVMDRHPDWCTVVCLVGGGQEINVGEAGLSEWMSAIRKNFQHWRVHASAKITQPDYDLNKDAQDFIASRQVTLQDGLHLGVSIRSFRAETLSDFIAHVLNGDAEAARASHASLDQYPLVITRDLDLARQWLRNKARGTERYGLVASSGAHRLKPEGVHIKAAIEPANWFLNDHEDVRSSYYLEDAATEFDVQGLELDWTAVCWDADYRFEGEWLCRKFSGTEWRHIRDRFNQIYLKNAYRVILTRARQGMVIFVPRGDEADATRPPGFYDGTWDFLVRCGIPPL